MKRYAFAGRPRRPLSTHALGLEILDDLPDAVLVAIGGGGLISGLSTTIRAKRPRVKIIGIEPRGSPTLK
jgi:threonine dehydratase